MSIGRIDAKRWVVLLIFIGLFLLLISSSRLWEEALGFMFSGEDEVLHPRASLLLLVGEHMRLVAISSSITILIAIPLGVWVTRSAGRDFLPVVNDLTSIGQTFPPVAVLALAVPMLGFGTWPTVTALFLYGLLPVVRNTIAGLQAVSADVRGAASGMSMSRMQILGFVELPLAAPVILAGVRTSIIINVGTAMVGAVIGAGGLGSPIIAGLVQYNTAFVLEGAIPAALLAILIDQFMANVEGLFAFPGMASSK